MKTCRTNQHVSTGSSSEVTELGNEPMLAHQHSGCSALKVYLSRRVIDAHCSTLMRRLAENFMFLIFASLDVLVIDLRADVCVPFTVLMNLSLERWER